LFPRPREDFIALPDGTNYHPSVGAAPWTEARYAAIDRGWGELALSDDKQTKKGHRETPKPLSSRQSGAERAGSDRDVGHALRSVYAKTVSEDIPPELLDLLGKLN
jgi:hypothetical protein